MRLYELKLKNLGLSWKTHKGGIYLFIFPNGKKYIGQTKDFYHRFLSYKSNLKYVPGDKKYCPVYGAIKEFGWDNITIKLLYVIDDCRFIDRKILLGLEKYYIEKYNTINNGYNILSSTNPPYEVKKKISSTLKDKYNEGVIDIKNRVKIEVFYDGESIGIFKSITAAADNLGCSENVIGNRIKNYKCSPKTPYLGHYTFKIV